MSTKNIEKSFFKYVMSSMVTMFLQSLYSIVDGLFISNFSGANGLSAINVVWPILAVIIAMGTGIGCGGSVVMSTMQGAGRQKESDQARANVILLLLGASIIATVLFLMLLSPFLKMNGAEGEIYDYAMLYGTIMISGAGIQIFAAGLTPLLRNDNRAVLAMKIMVSGLILNLVLNFTLMYIFGLGIVGAAVASLIAQSMTSIICLFVLITNKTNPMKKEQFKVSGSIIKKTLQTGVSPFGISLTPSLLILYHNIQCLRIGGEIGIGVFAIITSTVGAYRVLLIGIAEGIQPLVSFARGANDFKAIRNIRNKGIKTAILASVFLFLFTLVTAGFYPKMFHYTGEMADLSYKAIMLTSTQLIFTGFVRVSNSFFYAVGKNKYSLFLIYFDPLFMTPLLITILPIFFGLNGIWIELTISQFILNVIGTVMYKKHENEMKAAELKWDTEESGAIPVID